MLRKTALIAVLAACAAVPAAATTIHEPYSSFWVLGDSLSDNGISTPRGQCVHE
jgi:hypothetical protein